MKRLLLCLIFATVIFSASFSVCAEESVTLPQFDVTFGEEEVESNYRQHPLIVYKDITYVPMTYYDCRYLGLKTDWYDETTGESMALEEKGDEELYLVAATGGYHTYAVMKNASGNKTVVKTLWADKTMPEEHTVIFETKTGTFVSKIDNLICVRTAGDSPDDEVRFFIAGNDGEHEYATFSSSDVVSSVFVYDNILLYKFGKDKVARVDLR